MIGKRLTVSVLSILLLFGLISFEAKGQDILNIEDACVMEPPPASPNAAAFMTITNRTNSKITIEGVECDVAKKAEIHQTIRSANISQMRHVGRLTIPAGGTVRLEHGGYHLMLVGLKKRLKRGDVVSLRFNLEGGKTVSFRVSVCRMKRGGMMR